MPQHEPESRSRVGLAPQGHWSFAAPSATLTTQPWSEPSTLFPLRTVSTIEAPSLRGGEVFGQSTPRPDLTGLPASTTPLQELPGDLLDNEVPLDNLLPWEVSGADEVLELDEAHLDHPGQQLHPSLPPPESSSWRAPAPVGGESATISFEDGPQDREVVGRRPARSELTDPMKILQGVAGFIVMLLLVFIS